MSSDWAGTHHACISQSRLRLVLFYAVYSQVFPWIKHVEFVAGVKQVLLMSFGKSALPPHSREWTRPLHVLAVQCLLQTSPVTQPPVHCIHTTQTYILFGRPMPAACEVWSAKSMRNDCYISANVLWTPTLILKLTISSEGSEQTFPTIYCPYGNIVNFPHVAWLSVLVEVQICIWPFWCHCHSPSLASVKSRLVLVHTHMHTTISPLSGLCLEQPGWAGWYQKVHIAIFWIAGAKWR